MTRRSRWFLGATAAGLMVVGFGLWATSAAPLPSPLSAAPGRGPYEHGPSSAGKCTICHTPHDAARSGGLVAPEKELCFQCHQDLKTDLASGYRHQVVREKPCTTCHDPHKSPYPHLLKARPDLLCLECHTGIAEEARRKTVHGPVKQGQCTACHAPHNSPYRKLLREAFDERFYAPYSTRRFALCFGCHNADLARQKLGKATGFRDGTKSDHYFHVNDPAKGRSCWVCHEAHGSDQPHLVRRTVKFGQWQLPLVFTELPNGGACLCGCHKRLEYRRT